MKFIIGKKIEMTQIWKDGKQIAVTKVQADPCAVVQIKEKEKDGYQAVQVAFGKGKEKRTKKPQKNHLAKAGLKGIQILKEFRVDNTSDIKIGSLILVDNFLEGDIVDVTGVSKGKGFAGVVKRYGFQGSKKTHGNKDQLRMPGSIGATGPAHVFKGTRMGGRMGGEQVTTKNLEIVEVDLEKNILLVKGAVPGTRKSLVFIVSKGDLKFSEPKAKENKKEDVVVENKDTKTENSDKKEEKIDDSKKEDTKEKNK